MVSVPSFGSIKKYLGNLCMPSKIYLAISVFFLLFDSFSLITLIVKLIFIGVWTFILNWICSKNYETISWILVIFPYVLFFLFSFLGIDILKNNVPKGEKGENEKKEEQEEKGENGQKEEKVEQEDKEENGEKVDNGEKQPSVDIQKNIDMTVQPHFNNTDLYSKQNRQYVSF